MFFFVFYMYSYQEILHSIHLTKKGNPGLKTCDGYQELLKFLRTDIIEVASRLQKGGLGYMEDTSEFEERVRNIKTMWQGWNNYHPKNQDIGQCYCPAGLHGNLHHFEPS